MFRGGIHRAVVVTTLLASMPDVALATWSIVIADSETKEVAVGTVTCLNNFDLLAIVPVVVVGRGSAAVQAAGDFNGIRRPIIFEQFMLGTDPEEILNILSGISGHQQRQYGIADTHGRMVTFTGSGNSQWAGGVIGQQGSMVYTIQGNILAGGCVVPAIESAVLNTVGDVAEKLMAGMRAARDTGGDGRCSCSSGDPTGCGCPPADFTKSGHIGGMVVARIGDIDDAVCDAGGCVDGDYFMRLNIPFQSSGAPDPVDQLQELFDAWRLTLEGRPDAIQSLGTLDPPNIPPNGSSTTTMHITLLDWQGGAIAGPIQSITVEHAPESDGLSAIGAVVDEGGGEFSVTITAGTADGVDRFRITVDDGIRPVSLMPDPSLEYFAFGDGDADGDVDVDDFAQSINCTTGPGGGAPPPCDSFDFDFDEDVDWHDAAAFQLAFTGDCSAIVMQQPQDETVCLDAAAVFEVEAIGVELSYQWRHDGADIPGATEPTLIVDPVTPESTGAYDVAVSSECPTVLSDEAVLSVFAPPVIVNHPEELGVCSGESAEFTVDASGAEPLFYQWQFDGGDIEGENVPVLLIPQVGPRLVGAYRCIVTDMCGQSTPTETADLSIRNVEITSQPIGGEVCIGGTVFLFVSAAGNPTFQWFKDDVPIPGETSPFLAIPDATTDDAGVYHVLAANDCNAVTSDDAVVAVIDCGP